MTGVTVSATYTLKGDAAAGSSSVAVWNEFTYVYDETHKSVIQLGTRTFAFDRKSAQLIDCCGASVNGNSGIQQTGVVGYVFPIGTQQKTYDVFDTTLNRPEPFTYAGTDNIDGIQAYRFVENVPPTQMGYTGLSVTDPEYYQTRLTYWVDPETGQVLDISQSQKQYLANPTSGAATTVLFDGDLAATPASVSALVNLDSSSRDKISLLGTILPLTLGIVGAVALVAGILLGRKPRGDLQVDSTAQGLAAVGAAEQPAAEQASAPHIVPGMEDESQHVAADGSDGEAQKD